MEMTARKQLSIAIALLLLSGLQSCFDFSDLEDYGQLPESPHLAVDRPPQVTPHDDVVVPTVPDIHIPDLAVDFAGLEDFELAAVEPAEGDIDGGEVVLLVGSGFKDQMEVFFGDIKANDPFVVTGNFATVVTPPHPPGPVDLKLAGGSGEVSVLAGGFVYVAQLAVEGVEPTMGTDLGGTPILISGSGFDSSCFPLIGGRKSPFVLVADGFSIQAVTPPGHCGPADVTVLCADDGGALKDAFFYTGPPRVDTISPKVGAVAGGTLIRLGGKSFTPGMSVELGDVSLGEWALDFVAPTQVEFKTPGGEPGPQTLRLTNECGQAEVEAAFVYVEEEPADLGPQVVGISPGGLPACQGGFVTLALAGVADYGWLQVFFGEDAADIVAIDEDLGIIDVLVYPADPGWVEVEVLTVDGTVIADQPFLLVPGPSIESVSPATGSMDGGTLVTVTGCAFPPELELRFGASVATQVEVLPPSTISAATPPGSPGPVDVLVVGGGQAVLPNGYSYLNKDPELFLVDPGQGSVAGGTYVRFHGAGLPPNASYFVGDKECFNVNYIDSSLVTARVPPNKAGTYDVNVEWPAGGTGLESSYTYFDPKTKKGGVWGGPIDESLNVTVLDSSNGKGVVAAYVVVGSDPDSPHMGFTDENGQITFSAPGLHGKQQITAMKQGYNIYSIVHFDGQNATVYLNPLVQGQGGSPTPKKEVFVAGKVYGLEKYVMIPPGDCANKMVDGVLCKPCQSDADCLFPDPEAPKGFCTDIIGTGAYCSLPCLIQEDCPDGYVCTKASLENTGCIPKGGDRAVKCMTSQSSMFGSSPDPGPGGDVNLHDIYFVSARPGELAVVCYGGYVDADTGQFTPTVMGLKRHIIVFQEQVVEDQDVYLDIPLTREAKIAFHDLPYHPNGIRKPYMLISMELGKDGYLSLPMPPEWVDEGEYFLLSPLPELTGELLGTTFSMYSSVQSNTMLSLPYAVRMVTEVESLFGDGIAVVADAGTTVMHPPINGDIVALAYRAADDIMVGTNQGELFHHNGFSWTPVGLSGTKEGFTTAFSDADGGFWLGGGNGTIWHHAGASWSTVASGQSSPVRGIWAAQGLAQVVFDGSLVSLDDQGVVNAVPAPAGHELTAVWGSDHNDLWVLTDQSSIYNFSATGWDAALTLPGHQFHAVDGSGPDSVWIVGEPGLVAHWDGDGFVIYQIDPVKALRAVHAAAADSVYVAGDDGLLFRYQANEFEPLDTGTLQDFRTLDVAPDSGRVAAAGIQAYNLGPFMAYPNILAPQEAQYFDFDVINWDYWTPGAKADYHFLTMSTVGGYPFWLMTVDGQVTSVELPPVVQILGLNILPQGEKRMNLTSSLNPDFDIDNYTLNDFSIYRKVTWSVDLRKFK